MHIKFEASVKTVRVRFVVGGGGKSTSRLCNFLLFEGEDGEKKDAMVLGFEVLDFMNFD